MKLSPGSSDVVQEYQIHYGEEGKGLYLLCKIKAVQEEGFDDVNWFDVRIVYPATESHGEEELSPWALDYREIRRGGPEYGPVEESIINWAIEKGLPISEAFPPEKNWHKRIEYGNKMLNKILVNQKIAQEEQKRIEDDEFYKDWLSIVEMNKTLKNTG